MIKKLYKSQDFLMEGENLDSLDFEADGRVRVNIDQRTGN